MTQYKAELLLIEIKIRNHIQYFNISVMRILNNVPLLNRPSLFVC